MVSTARGLTLALMAGGVGSAMTMPRYAAAADLRWTGPETCSEEQGVVEEAERLLGHPLAAATAIDFEIEVRQESGGTWVLLLRTVERSGGERRTRALSGPSCEKVANAAAVAIAMTVQLGAAEEASEASETPPQQPARESDEAKAEPRGAPKPTRPPAEPLRHPMHGAFGLGAAGDLGALPRAAPGVELDATLLWRSLRVTALGSYFGSQETRVAGQKGGQFDLLLAGLLACGEHGISRSIVFGCLGAEVGRLSGVGVGIKAPHPGQSPWEAARVDAGVFFPFGSGFGLVARIAAAFPLIRREFVIDQTEPVHRPASVTGRALFGIELRLE